jgi:hypothetical protein
LLVQVVTEERCYNIGVALIKEIPILGPEMTMFVENKDYLG